MYWIQTATDTVNLDSATSRGFQTADSAISSDGSTISINGYLTNSSLNVEILPAYIDWETWLPAATYGQKLSQDGSILYQPLTNGVDLVERNTGRLLYRVQVPGTLANVYDPMFLGTSPERWDISPPQGSHSSISVVFLHSCCCDIAVSGLQLCQESIQCGGQTNPSETSQRARTGRPVLTYAEETTRKGRY